MRIEAKHYFNDPKFTKNYCNIRLYKKLDGKESSILLLDSDDTYYNKERFERLVTHYARFFEIDNVKISYYSKDKSCA